MLNLMPIKLAVVIVLYKKRYTESIAIQTMLDQVLHDEYLDVTFHIWNNSPAYSTPLVREGVIWHLGNNDSLSSIYNKIANLAFSSGYDFFMISDDDTDYSTFNLEDNMTEISRAMRTSIGHTVGVFLPRIYANNILVSPGKRFHFLGRLSPFIETGFNRSKNLLAINSGVVITRFCYEKMNMFYDERLKFYATDTDFFIRYEKYFEYVYVLDSKINHDLSEYSSDTLERGLFKFGEMVRGYRIIFSEKGFVFQSVLEVYFFYAAIKKSIAYKSIKFFIFLGEISKSSR